MRIRIGRNGTSLSAGVQTSFEPERDDGRIGRSTALGLDVLLGDRGARPMSQPCPEPTMPSSGRRPRDPKDRVQPAPQEGSNMAASSPSTRSLPGTRQIAGGLVAAIALALVLVAGVGRLATTAPTAPVGANPGVTETNDSPGLMRGRIAH
jgi:hypothetical protein